MNRAPAPPRNRDLEQPARAGDDMGTPEPLAPPSPEHDEHRQLPEEETYERDRDADVPADRSNV